MLWGSCIYDVWCFGQSEVIRVILFEDTPCCGGLTGRAVVQVASAPGGQRGLDGARPARLSLY